MEMDRGAAGFLFALLFLANFLNVINAEMASDHVTYMGHSNPSVGIKWQIQCYVQPNYDVKWTRDYNSLEKEIADKELNVTIDGNTSTLSAPSGKPSHTGTYRCTTQSPLIDEGHKLRIYGGSSPDQIDVIVPAPKLSDQPDQGYRVLVAGKNMSLFCNTNATGPVFWKLGDTDIKADDKHYTLLRNGTELVLRSPVHSMIGNYTCRLNNSATSYISVFKVIGPPAVKLDPTNLSVVEGEKLVLTCQAPAHLGPTISWVYRNRTYKESSDVVELSEDKGGIQNSKLSVKNMNKTESEIDGEIYCNVVFDQLVGNNEASAFTRFTVKDKLAALWPFLGICIEVIVLCVIILIYEKKRNKGEPEESDTDQSPDTKWSSTRTEEYFIPLQGPLAPSVLPVEPNPLILLQRRNSPPDYKAVHFQNPSKGPRGNSSPSKPASNKDGEVRQRK